MRKLATTRVAFAALLALSLAACAGKGKDNDSSAAPKAEEEQSATIWDLFDNRDDPHTTLQVNKYIWNASLEVLDFLPIETVDPFSGVIVTGWGTAPGSNVAYRATISVKDPSLDARSLRVSLVTRNGAADATTLQAIENAILTRARQLRMADNRL